MAGPPPSPVRGERRRPSPSEPHLGYSHWPELPGAADKMEREAHSMCSTTEEYGMSYTYCSHCVNIFTILISRCIYNHCRVVCWQTNYYGKSVHCMNSTYSGHCNIDPLRCGVVLLAGAPWLQLIVASSSHSLHRMRSYTRPSVGHRRTAAALALR